ncbi:radical SAM protein [candidate division WOR-3 bacterium]|nr:radical SAM protein [candidate division WOR-3 bacterium]
MEYEIYKLPGLSIKAKLKDNDIEFTAEGFLKHMANPIVKQISEYFSTERPAIATEEKYVLSGWLPYIPSPALTRLLSNQVKIKMNGIKIPEQISIAVTGKCPCDCIFCCAKGIRAEPELTFDEIKSIIDQGIEMGTHLFTFDGGEPLLRKDIYDIISYANSTGSLTVMFTNGLYLDGDVAHKLKKAGLDTLQVSIDSPYQEEHDKIRKVKGIFKKATAGAQSAVEAGLFVSLYNVVRRTNSDRKTLNDLLSLAEKLGAHEVSFYDILAIGKWLEREDDTLTDEERESTIKFHKEVNQKGNKGPKVMAFSYFESPERFGCMAGRRWIHFTPAGDLIPCSYTPLTFGNIRETSLKNLWEKVRKHAEYVTENRACMIQDKEFRKRYIYPIPKDASLPYPIEKIQ